MYFVYVLASLQDGSRYVGFTSKDLSLRLRWHNEGSNRSTRRKGPYKIVHSESFTDESIALAREKFFKSGRGRKVLENILGQ